MTKNRFQKPTQPSGGLGNLLSRSLQFSGASLPADERAAETQRLSLSALVPNPRQPRRYFDQGSLDQLAESIRVRGILQPLMVRPLSAEQSGGSPADHKYEIVYGERRWRAAQQAGLGDVPVIIRELSAAEAEVISAVENLQREDLNRYDEVTYKLRLVAQLFETTPEDAVQVLKQLRAQPGSQPEQVTQLEELFTQLGREQWRSFVTNGLPALRLPSGLVQAVQSGRLDYSKALLIARAPKAHHAALLRKASNQSLTHAQLREAVAQLQPALQATATPLMSVRKKLSTRRLSRLPAERRQRAEALLNELNSLLGEETEERHSS